VDRGRREWTEGRPLYRPSPGRGTPSRNAWRPERGEDRYSKGSWQDRASGSPQPAEDGAGTDPLSPPELLGGDEELVAGRRPVAEAFAARRPAKRLLVVPDRRQALEQLVIHATALRIPVVEVEGGTLTSVSGFDGHQGIALVVEPRRWASIDDVLARAMERGEPPLVLVLDSLEDPQNVGTLLRTAEANGVHGVIFPTRRSAPISPAAVKASAGAVEHLLLVPLDDLAGGLVDLRSHGLRIVGADEDAPLSYRDADLRGPLALVIGSEGHGISGVVHRRLDHAVRIPMRGKIASLNAAVAGSVLLFEAASQRGLGETDRATTIAREAALLSAAPADPALPEGEAAADETPRPKRARKAKVGSSPESPVDAAASHAEAEASSPDAEAFIAGADASSADATPVMVDVQPTKPKRARKPKPAPQAEASAEDLLPD
jgi:23S rRNA (guanosine2251-2'-O)-methyltransferase